MVEVGEGISRKGLDFLKEIIMRKEHELTDDQKSRMRKELMEEPNLFDPLERNNDIPTGTSVYLPLWMTRYLRIRKIITGKPVSKQIEAMVKEFIASEILELLEEGSG
jgi:hypothetical protein